MNNLPDLTERKLCFIDKKACLKEKCMAWVMRRAPGVYEVDSGELLVVGKCAFLIAAEHANSPLMILPDGH